MGLEFRREIDAAALWEHLPETAHRVALDPPELHPVPGSKVEASCHWHVFGEPVHDAVYTSERLRAVLERHGKQEPLFDADRMTSVEEDRLTSAGLVASVGPRFRAALDAGRDADFLCVGAQELHSVTHSLGHHWIEEHWRRPEPREPELVERVYEAVDAALAPLVDAFADGRVVILFTHGMRPGNRGGGLLEGFLERAGYLVRAEQTPEASGRWLAQRARTLVPERARRAVSRRLPKDVQHRLASTRFRESYRWSETRVVAPPAWTTGFLRANVRGRESLGIVPPGELDALLTEVAALLLEVENADTGEPLVRRVVRAQDDYPGTLSHTLPDLLVEWHGDAPATRARHPRLGEWEGPIGEGHYWTSHSERALAFFSGAGVRHDPEPGRGEAEGFAPTLLGLCGIEPPVHMTGTPWDVGAR
jgi:predicted AlkP superfamily phosphohydrolase/phosphomutase